MNVLTSDLPPWFEPRLPRPEECSLGLLLAERARQAPDAVCVVFEDGSSWSNAVAFQRCRIMAAHLRGLGVAKGDVVLNWQPNGPDLVRVVFAASMLGAVHLPVNVAFRGAMLAHVLTDSGAKLLVANPELVDRLQGVDCGQLAQVFVTGKAAVENCPLPMVREHQLPEPAALPSPETNQPWDVADIIYSSGTTGPSKGVLITYAQLWTKGLVFNGYWTPEDRVFVQSPFFHIAAMQALFAAMSLGGSIAVVEPVSPSAFWEVFARTGATAVAALGNGMITFLNKTPPSPADADNRLRVVGVPSVDRSSRAFAARFGCDLIARFGMTEASGVTCTEVNPAKDNTIGRARKGLQIRVVDAHDMDVPVGKAGEMIVRTDHPWMLANGYHNNPTATAAAWRNGWFHTGDMVRADEDGDLYYVDRLKDAIRRRGENISAYEVENEIRMFPGVHQVGVVGVKTGGDDEEVLAVVTLEQPIDPAELIAFLVPRLPHFMIPRYVRVVDELPTTANHRVKKSALRDEGLTADCWDRESAGVMIRRHRFSPASSQ